MLNHAISDYFHFDHQFFHTLKPLLLKPGLLTVEYLKGRRAQYLHPVKMYIFISLIYFLLIFKSNHQVVKVNETPNAPSKKEALDEFKKNVATDGSLTAEQKKKISETVDNFVPETKSGLKTAEQGSPVTITASDKDNEKDSTVAQYNLNQSKLPANQRDGFWKHFFTEHTLSYEEKYGKKEAWPHFMEDVKHNMPKMMFVLLPLFALILKIAFWKNRKYYVEHLIYSIHLHCFFFLFSGIVLIIQLILPDSHSLSDWLTLFVMIYTVYYIYRSLRVLYQRSRWRTISKMAGITIMYWAAAIICGMGLLMVTAVTA